MSDVFETYKPKNSLISNYVDYYYIDIKPNNEITEIQCFPHFNTAISLYNSHYRDENKNAVYENDGSALQIFTPVNKEILNVRQIGYVHRIVIVFKPLGIHQFFKDLDFTSLVHTIPFFDSNELHTFFNRKQDELLADLIDQALVKRFKRYKPKNLEESVHYIFDNFQDFSVENTAIFLSTSRKQLNRLFQKHIGVSIKKFHQIVMFRKAVQSKLIDNPKKSFTEIAHELYFSDQPHFNKAFQLFTRKSPGIFFSQGTHLGNEDTFWHIKK